MKQLLVLALLAGMIVGCDKETTGPDNATVSIPSVTFKGPNTSSTDSHAQNAINDAASMTGLTAQSSIFASIPGTTNGNTTTWTFPAGTYTQTFKGVKQSDGSYTWSYILNGTDGSTTYNNFVLWDGTTSIDGKSGNWKFYDYGKNYPDVMLEYSTSSSGVLTGTWKTYSSATTVTSTHILINNADGSGSDTYYQGTATKIYEITWIANGTGTWKTYSSGTQTGSGTF